MSKRTQQGGKLTLRTVSENNCVQDCAVRAQRKRDGLVQISDLHEGIQVIFTDCSDDGTCDTVGAILGQILAHGFEESLGGHFGVHLRRQRCDVDEVNSLLLIDGVLRVARIIRLVVRVLI
jgi:hypothetical protein